MNKYRKTAKIILIIDIIITMSIGFYFGYHNHYKEMNQPIILYGISAVFLINVGILIIGLLVCLLVIVWRTLVSAISDLISRIW